MRSSPSRTLVAAAVALATTLSPGPLCAGGPLGAQGTRLATSDYRVDLFQGPVLAGTRIIGLAGAYTAIAEGADGIQFNPASASLRPPYSTTRDDYDLTGGFTLPASVEGTDFDNNGQIGFAYDDFVWVNAGGLIQTRRLGFGVLASFQNYDLGAPSSSVELPNSSEVVRAVTVRLLRIDPVVSYGFWREQLHVGVGARFAAFYGIARTDGPDGAGNEERLLVNANTAGVQVGALFAPRWLPLRVGAALRSPTAPVDNEPGRIRKNAEGDRVVGDFYLPNRLELPWEAEAGIAVQLWKRPFNIAWRNEEDVPRSESEPRRRTVDGRKEPHRRAARRMLRERYLRLPRESLLLSFSALVSGPVSEGLGLESVLSQTVDRSGERPSLTLRGGAEAELVPHWFVARAGSYLEPSRFRAGSSRLHGTAGFDLCVFSSTVFGLFEAGTRFRMSAAVDVARDYFGFGAAAGVFH